MTKTIFLLENRNFSKKVIRKIFLKFFTDVNLLLVTSNPLDRMNRPMKNCWKRYKNNVWFPQPKAKSPPMIIRYDSYMIHLWITHFAKLIRAYVYGMPFRCRSWLSWNHKPLGSSGRIPSKLCPSLVAVTLLPACYSVTWVFPYSCRFLLSFNLAIIFRPLVSAGFVHLSSPHLHRKRLPSSGTLGQSLLHRRQSLGLVVATPHILDWGSWGIAEGRGRVVKYYYSLFCSRSTFESSLFSRKREQFAQNVNGNFWENGTVWSEWLKRN